MAQGGFFGGSGGWSQEIAFVLFLILILLLLSDD
jgi:hypothetical protein